MRWAGLGVAAALGCAACSCSHAKVEEADVAQKNGQITHPGAVAKPAELVAQLAAVYAAKGKDYEPRTRHKNADGTAQYVNRLITATSPYLLQHAHNPVDWRPWGPEALAEALALGRPLFISVGYSTCHWCHVMEEESFEDEATAAILNSRYVPIKIDREERPDVDNMFMAAVHKLRRRGGWPMSIWADSEGLPFFAGTYFPPDGKRGARRGFQTLLNELADRWQKDPEAVRNQARELGEELAQEMRPKPPGPLLGAQTIRGQVAWFGQRFDTRWGGFTGAPKFPSSLPVHLLLRVHRRTGDPRLLQMATVTLERMQEGGMHDQLGGGFHRYSVDERWLVPHFEKMLYDNALLARDYTDAFQVTGRADFAATARAVLDYVRREMTAPSGGFYSATDADSEGEEGTFFVWDKAEVERLLSADQARVILNLWGVTQQGNFEHKNIFSRVQSVAQVAAQLKMSEAQVIAHREAARPILYAHRAKRIPPGLDDKIMTDWNGLMAAAFARAAWVYDAPEYLAAAKAAVTFSLEHLQRPDGRLRHTTKDGVAQDTAFLEDYAFLIHALIELAQADGNGRWLGEAVRLQALQDRHYGDAQNGGWFLTAADQPVHIAREKPDYDGAIPTGNSFALHNVLRLAELTGDARYRTEAARHLKGLSRFIARGAMSYGSAAVERYLDVPKEVLIVHPDGAPKSDKLAAKFRSLYLPNALQFELAQAQVEGLAKQVPWLKDKVAQDGQATAYVCEQGVCQRPTNDPGEMARQLAEVERF
jgi:uncharacterized protein